MKLDKNFEPNINLLTASIDLKHHPLSRSNRKKRVNYCLVLEYFVKKFANGSELVYERLNEYKKVFLGDISAFVVTDRAVFEIIAETLDKPQAWSSRYRQLFVCDLALILVNYEDFSLAFSMLGDFISNKRYNYLCGIKDGLYSDSQQFLSNKSILHRVSQLRANRSFFMKREKRILVTANMSAGKSTLINALVGKVVSSMSLEACTSSLRYVYQKPLDDGIVMKFYEGLTFDAKKSGMKDCFVGDLNTYIATYFFTFANKEHHRFCFVDSPGVNSSINRRHELITRKALVEECYDMLIYVFNANRLGTDDELRHLNFVKENVPNDKVVFVVNKLDDFQKEDSVEKSIEALRNDLLAVGYKDPVVYPISAYCALLVKKKLVGEILSEDEQDEFELFSKKFKKPNYNLSRFYPHISEGIKDVSGVLEAVAVNCGLYGLECTLFGGVER